MPEIFLHITGPLRTDPELKTGDILTLERSDGRPVWRQRLKMVRAVKQAHWQPTHYILSPADMADG